MQQSITMLIKKLNKLVKMKKFTKFAKTFAAGALVLAMFASCSDNNDGPGEEVFNDFHIAFANGSGSNSATLLQGVANIDTGSISSQIGHEMESSRTARIFSAKDGSTIYSLNYTEGTVEKLTYHGKDSYTRVGRIDTSVPLGVKTVRFTKLNEQEASLHYIKATAEYDGDEYQQHKMVASIGILDLASMKMKEGYNGEIEITLNDDLAKQGYYISRIDCPVLSGNKLYYGASVSKFNASTGKGEATDRTFTLVLDYPSLTNATTISTTKVKGATNGYRTPTQHINEAGEILQMVSGGNEVHIVKIKNGKYDEIYDFNLTKLLNKPASSNGFFYAGNGIAYIPYQDLDEEKVQIGVDPSGVPSYSAMWKLARMDFNKGTAVDLNVPRDLWLQQYQNSVVRNGVFYIALSPVGSDGNIYKFNVNSESANGTLGAKITGTGSDQYYIGIY